MKSLLGEGLPEIKRFAHNMYETGGLGTNFNDMQDAITGERISIRIKGGRIDSISGTLPGSVAARDIDGSNLLVYPSLYDADAHMPLVPIGLRVSDVYRALAGGVSHMNVALPWQLARGFDLRALIADITRYPLPRITPILSVSPSADSQGFPAWLAEHGGVITETLPPVCKLYSMDPNFEANLDAVLKAGLMPMLWFAGKDALRRTAPTLTGPAYFRHAISAEVLALMRAAPRAIVQTSPHFLLPLAPGKSTALTVLPPPPSETERRSLSDRLIDAVDVIASDHVGPAISASAGPGLQTQQHFLPALLAARDLHDWPLAPLLAKATTAPANAFGVDFQPGFVIVDPSEQTPVSRWPRQGEDRAPYENLPFRHRVVAVGAHRVAELV